VEEVFRTAGPEAFTSELKVVAGRLAVGVCAECGHCMTVASPALGQSAFYEQEYALLMGSAEEDDLFSVAPDGRPIYRSEAELDNLEALAALPPAGAILDFGCGKGAFLRLFMARHPAWRAHGFEVSDRYRALLARVIPADRIIVGADALAQADLALDLVTAFQVVEHLDDPAPVLTSLRRLLAPEGAIHVTVPDLRANSVDVFVADHLSHFTAGTLTRLFARCGFEPIAVSDRQSGQITARFRPAAAPALPPADPAATRWVTDEIAAWDGAGRRAADFIRRTPGTYLYGAGAVGTALYLAAGRHPHALGFLDQNPFKTGRTHLGLPVHSPRACPPDLRAVVVAVPPSRARAIMATTGLGERGLPLLFPWEGP
jgi:SAM-dependent methyltransferase